jgi:hypothetical protein
MAAAKKVKALILDQTEIEAEFFEDCSLIGLRMDAEAYKSVWQINQLFNMQFERDKYFGQLHDYKFELYQYYDKAQSLNHTIYTNRKDGHTLVSNLKGYNLLWLINGADNRFYFTQTIKNIAAKTTAIDLVKEIDLDVLDGRGLLLF